MISSVDALRVALNQTKETRGKKLDLNRLKALIIDEGPTVLNNASKSMINTFTDLGRKGMVISCSLSPFSLLIVEIFFFFFFFFL